ncbi:MAG: nucleoside hydrolase [Clostridia bacterium]|nr:nucleoside hydrolase [Clostridia bacterium]
MDYTQYMKNLTSPTGKVDVILDTDAFNEIDDQFAICYLLRSRDRLNLKGLCAAPFLNENSTSPADGMEKSYNEIFKLLDLSGDEDVKSMVYRGSTDYLPDEQTPVESEAADFMAKLANDYSPENPLYIVAIGAITNVASAYLKNPAAMKENTVIVWLGGHADHIHYPAKEFNMRQDIAAARVLLASGVPFVMLPCAGVVDCFTTSRYELEHWLKGKNSLCDYLLENTIRAAEKRNAGRPWTRVIWDVTAVAWLLNDDKRFMFDELRHAIIPEYDMHYAHCGSNHFFKYVYKIHRDNLFEDLFKKLAN